LDETSADPSAQIASANATSVGAAERAALLVNLGTPDAPTPAAVRRYLAEFLSDPRVVDYPRALWLPLLHGLILNVRPQRSARGYARVWRPDNDGSPLRHFTRRQSEKLASLAPIRIDWAMRYGRPSIVERLAAMRAGGVRRVLLVPLYPQYSATTTASVEDESRRALDALGWRPELRVAEPFHRDPLYIGALKAVATRELSALSWAPQRILLSFHGLPQRYVDGGDPYFEQCRATADLLRAAIGWSEDFAPMTFQSKFGPGRWLEPGTSETLRALGRTGVKRVAVMTPGFVSDCIETLEEIAVRGRNRFIGDGGELFTALACLNDSDEMIALLASIVARA